MELRKHSEHQLCKRNIPPEQDRTIYEVKFAKDTGRHIQRKQLMKFKDANTKTGQSVHRDNARRLAEQDNQE